MDAPKMTRLLMIEDDPGISGNLERLISTCQNVFHGELEIMSAQTWNDGVALVSIFRPDVILLDLTFVKTDSDPGQSKDVTIKKLSLLAMEWPPVVVFTGTSDDSIRRLCFEAGASDYILKTPTVMKFPEAVAERLYNAFLRRSHRIRHGTEESRALPVTPA